MTPHTSDNAVELAARLRSSAKAFRENTVYGQDGDPLRLGVQADECDEAADFIESHCTPAPTMEMDGLYARLAELLAKATPGPWWDAGWPYSGQIHGGERCKIREAEQITGLDIRTLQEKAAAGLIPGAEKPFGRWTFDVAATRRLKGTPCPRASTRETAYSGRVSRSGGSNIARAYELVLSQSRSAG
jgi:hypothetical protein